MPTLQQLRYLVAVADTLHFRRAAERTNVTQPTLSGQIMTLEKTLGVKLVERSRANVVMTPVGNEIAVRARQALQTVGEIEEVAKRGTSFLGGTLRLGVIHTLGPYLLPLFLPQLHRDFEVLKLYVREGLPQALLADLHNGHIDLILYPVPVLAENVETVRLFREPLLCVAPTENALAAYDIVPRQAIRGQTVLTLESGYKLHDQVEQLCERFGANLSLDYAGTSLGMVRQMVTMGMGISFMPALYVREELKDDASLAARLIQGGAPSRTIGLVWRRNSPHAAEYREFATLIRSALADSVSEVTVLK